MHCVSFFPLGQQTHRRISALSGQRGEDLRSMDPVPQMLEMQLEIADHAPLGTAFKVINKSQGWDNLPMWKIQCQQYQLHVDQKCSLMALFNVSAYLRETLIKTC